MIPATWVGIDPGGRFTGIVVRQGSELLGWMLIRRELDEGALGVGPQYIAAVVGAVTNLKYAAGAAVAVEALNAPTGFRNGKREPINPGHAMAAAMILGGVLAAFPHALLVPPGDNGAGSLSTYPDDLVTKRERIAGLNRKAGDSADIHHCRSAWDVAGTAPRIAAARIRGGAA